MKKLTNIILTVIAIVVLIQLAYDTSSKYIGKVNKINETGVAKWDVKLNGKTWSEDLDFNLFTSIKSETDEKLIAPGTEGEFEFIIKNDSDIASLYTMNINVENENNIPIEYKINDGQWITPDQAGNINLAMNKKLSINEEEIIKVSWKWSYDGSLSTNYTNSQTITSDNELGETGTASINVRVSIDAEQIKIG